MAPPRIFFGQVVCVANLLDPQGGNPKNRFAVVITPQEKIDLGDTLDIVAITGTFPEPPPWDHVPMPWHPEGKSANRFRKKCFAVCSWLDEVERDRVIESRGALPGKYLVKIQETLDELERRTFP